MAYSYYRPIIVNYTKVPIPGLAQREDLPLEGERVDRGKPLRLLVLRGLSRVVVVEVPRPRTPGREEMVKRLSFRGDGWGLQLRTFRRGIAK
jgi:hypothetical protein